MRQRALPLIAAIVVVACASSTTRPDGVTKADVDVALLNSLFFSSAGNAAASFEVRVTNTAEIPITIYSIRLSSPGMVQYSMQPVERRLRETVEPGQSATVGISATVFGNPGTTVNEEPFAVRVFLDFEANGARHHDIFNILNVAQP